MFKFPTNAEKHRSYLIRFDINFSVISHKNRQILAACQALFDIALKHLSIELHSFIFVKIGIQLARQGVFEPAKTTLIRHLKLVAPAQNQRVVVITSRLIAIHHQKTCPVAEFPVVVGIFVRGIDKIAVSVTINMLSCVF